MSPVLRNILAVILGWVIGSCINMGFITLGGSVVPPPPGADMNSVEGMQKAMVLFETRHYLFPFLAHAVGTFFGAAAAAWIAASHKKQIALGVGGLFLLAGIAAVFILPAPLWFEAADLILAYVPMAWLGWKVATFRQRQARLA